MRSSGIAPFLTGTVLASLIVAACGASGTTPAPPSDGAPALSPSPSGTAAVVPSARQTPTPSQATPTQTPGPTFRPEPTSELGKAATRIVIGSLKVDLPVVELPEPPTDPYCDVAMWWLAYGFVPPALPGATYVLAQPRPGMFLPLLDASKVNGGSAMIGTNVDVYTAANWRFTYAISAVHRHVDAGRDALDGPLSATTPELWLQTGEGPRGTGTVLQVVAKLVSATPATQADAQPLAQPVACP